MVKAHAKKHPTPIRLDLTGEEATYVKNLMQNFYGDGKETPEQYVIRASIWDALIVAGA